MIYHQLIDIFVSAIRNMTKDNKPQVDEDKLGRNPFATNLKIVIRKVAMPGQFKADDEGVYLPVEAEMEVDPICKLYVTTALRREVNNLSPRAIDLLVWVCYSMEAGADWLRLNHKRYMVERRVKSYNTYKDAVRELVGNNFLQPTIYQGVYWINPIFFFNGSRINKYPKNVVRK